MDAKEQQAAFAAAAIAAQEMIDAKQQARERVAQQLAKIDADIARLQVVIDLAGDPGSAGAPTVPRIVRRSQGDKEKRIDWGAIVLAIVGEHEPGGIILADVYRVLQSKHEHPHGLGHVKLTLARLEKAKKIYKDDERRWHVSAAAGADAPPAADTQAAGAPASVPRFVAGAAGFGSERK